MLDLTKCDPALLQLPDAVVTALLAQSTELRAESVMIVGAHCRDILRNASGQDSGLRTTEDIDFGLALADWASYDGLTKGLEPVGDTRIRYKVADVPTDLIPFGNLERPPGTVKPPLDQFLATLRGAGPGGSARYGHFSVERLRPRARPASSELGRAAAENCGMERGLGLG